MSALPKVGELVQYQGHEDFPQAAVVIMTAATYQENMDPSGQFKPADETSVSLKITRPVSGRSYTRHNVPLEGSEAHAALVKAQADYDEEAEQELPEGVTAEELAESAYEAGDSHSRPVVRSWKPVK